VPDVEVNYREFRLKIKDMENITVITSCGDGTFDSYDAKVQMDTLGEQTNDALNQMIIEKRLTTTEDFVVLGSHLYRTLFGEKTNEKFIKEYDEVAKTPGTVLRLVLEFEQNAAKLAEWPWEYLYYPDEPGSGGRGGGFFIAAEGELVLARRVPLDPITFEPLCLPLRILFIVGAEPKDYSEIVYKPVIQAIQELGAAYPGLVKIGEPLMDPTKDLLTLTIKTWKPHVVHYIGHGKYEEKDKKGYLSLKNEEKPDDPWIDEDTWAGCFGGFKPRLVFLQACDSGHSESYRGFKGVAYKLIYLKQSRLPAVIAMQHPIVQSVGIRFAKTFYRVLGERKPIGVAVQMARKDVAQNLPSKKDFSERSFGSPILFLQAEGPIIEQTVEPVEAHGEVQPQPQEVVDCPYSLHPDYGCGGKVRLSDKFCSTCHLPLQPCPKCGFIMAQYIGFCTECGFDLKRSLEPKREKMLAEDEFKKKLVSSDRPQQVSGKTEREVI
jgi:hypothetical protein